MTRRVSWLAFPARTTMESVVRTLLSEPLTLTVLPPEPLAVIVVVSPAGAVLFTATVTSFPFSTSVVVEGVSQPVRVTDAGGSATAVFELVNEIVTLLLP